jgi:hypothetical protein
MRLIPAHVRLPNAIGMMGIGEGPGSFVAEDRIRLGVEGAPVVLAPLVPGLRDEVVESWV